MAPISLQFALILYTLISDSRVHAQVAVPLVIRDPVYATEKENVHSGKCQKNSYILKVLHDAKKIDLVLNAGVPITLSESDLGKTLLHRPVVGDFAFMCVGEELEIRFFGYLLDANLPPKPISYLMAIDFSGKMRDDRGWKNESHDIVHKYFSYRARRQ